MDKGSSLEVEDKAERGKKGGSRIDPFVPRTDHNPRDLKSWAKRTGFVSTFSTETSASERNDGSAGFDLEKGFGHRGGGSSPKIEIDPILGRTTRNRGEEIEPVSGNGNGGNSNENDGVLLRGEKRRIRDELLGRDDGIGRRVDLNGNGKGNAIANRDVNRVGNENGNGVGVGVGVAAVNLAEEPKKDDEKVETDVEMNSNPDGEVPAHGGWRGPSGIICGLRDNPGFG